MERADESAHPDARLRWFQRVLPVVAVATVAVAVTALVLPGFRHQLTLSLTRQPDPYVELYFAPAARDGQTLCRSNGDGVDVRFVVASHLRDKKALTYRVVVETPDGKPQTSTGRVRVTPGQARGVVAPLTVADRSPYTVSVMLPQVRQELRARCPGRPS